MPDSKSPDKEQLAREYSNQSPSKIPRFREEDRVQIPLCGIANIERESSGKELRKKCGKHRAKSVNAVGEESQFSHRN